MEGKTLRLPLIKKWFDMTAAKIKPEEYREPTPFWCARLLMYNGQIMPQSWWDLISISDNIKDSLHMISPRDFTKNVMTLGYPKAGDKERTVTLEHLGIEIREGNPDWGAVPGKTYIVIKHGKILEP